MIYGFFWGSVCISFRCFFSLSSSSLPLDNSTIPTRTIQKKVKHKKRVFLDAFTYAPLLTYYINQLYYIIHILLLFSLHRLLSLWVGNKFFLYDVLPSFMFSPSVAVFSFWIGGLDVVRVRFLCAFLDLF